jgi:serine/threonine protein kinase
MKQGEQENGEMLAVKKLTMNMAGMDDQLFVNEVQHFTGICHPNIVRFEGYCCDTESELTFHEGCNKVVYQLYRLLCFEYMPNGSLDKYLSGMMILSSKLIVFLYRMCMVVIAFFFSDESSGLDWHTRFNIIEGICAGLYCLHEGREGAPILHLDLKPGNILLDKNMTPKIADFGLSRLFDGGKTHAYTQNIIGTR